MKISDKTIMMSTTKFVIACALFGSLCGCARFATTQTDISDESKKTRTITTKATAHTFFAAKSSLATWKASQTDKTQGATVGGLEQEASGAGTNITAIVEAVVSAAVKSAIKP